MKFKAFVATYSPQTGEMTNKHNYFMNGLVKDDLSETDCADVCDISEMRNLYALTDGSNSSARGEDAAFLCVEIMRNIVGSNFVRESEEYFSSANDIVKGQAFEGSGACSAVDMAAVYIYGNTATAYNIGDVSVFHFQDKELKKLSGKSPDTVEVEELVNNDGKLALEKVSKKTSPHIGYLSDECQIVPYVSEKTKVKKGDYIALISKEVSALLTEKEISAVLSDSQIIAEEKAIELVNRACDKKAEGNYTVQLIHATGRSVVRELRVAFGMLLATLIIAMTIFFVQPYASQIGESVTNAFYSVVLFLSGHSSDKETNIETVEPWVPISDEVNEEEQISVDEPTEEAEKTEEESKPETSVPASTTYKQPVSAPKPTSVNPATENEVEPPTAEESTDKSVEESTAKPVEESTAKPVESVPEPSEPPQVDNSDVELPINFN